MSKAARGTRAHTRATPHTDAQEDLHISTEALRLTRTQGFVSQDDWNTIASSLCARKGKQCRERWENKLMPSLSPEPFTSREHDIIVTEVEVSGRTRRHDRSA